MEFAAASFRVPTPRPNEGKANARSTDAPQHSHVARGTRLCACWAQPAARGCATRSDSRSSVIPSDDGMNDTRHLDVFVITLTVRHARPGAWGEVYLSTVCSLSAALAMSSLCFCLQRSLCTAFAAGAAGWSQGNDDEIDGSEAALWSARVLLLPRSVLRQSWGHPSHSSSDLKLATLVSASRRCRHGALALVLALVWKRESAR